MLFPKRPLAPFIPLPCLASPTPSQVLLRALPSRCLAHHLNGTPILVSESASGSRSHQKEVVLGGDGGWKGHNPWSLAGLRCAGISLIRCEAFPKFPKLSKPPFACRETGRNVTTSRRHEVGRAICTVPGSLSALCKCRPC